MMSTNINVLRGVKQNLFILCVLGIGRKQTPPMKLSPFYYLKRITLYVVHVEKIHWVFNLKLGKKEQDMQGHPILSCTHITFHHLLI